MKDPFGLEPADGDYVAYIEKLQAGKIRNLDPLKTAASSPAATNPVPPGTPESTAEAAEEREQSVMGELAKIGIPVPSPIPSVSGAARVKRTPATRRGLFRGSFPS